MTEQPADIDSFRRQARAMAAKGDYEQAIQCWQQVEQQQPGDAEAARMISALTLEKIRRQGLTRNSSQAVEETLPADGETGQSESQQVESPNRGPQNSDPQKSNSPRKQELTLTERQRLERAIADHPKDESVYLELADLYLSEGKVFEAHRTLTKAAAVSDDVRIVEKLEQVKLIRARQRVEAARLAAEQKDTMAARQALEEAETEALQLELRIYRARSQRTPEDHRLRYEIGLRLKQLGQYREAIEPLKAGLELPDFRARASFEIGEILQRFKQYPKALQCYRQSAQLAAARPDQVDCRKQSLYRAGLLAFTMKVLDSAEQYFQALFDLDPDYKDVRTHLDKLAEMREDF